MATIGQNQTDTQTPNTPRTPLAQRNVTQRSLREGLGFGLIGGVVMALVEILAIISFERPILDAFRYPASVALGEQALAATTTGTGTGTLVAVGSLVHLILSAAFGVIYGLFNARAGSGTQTSFGRQFALGVVFGLIVYLINLQVIARAAYPWFLSLPQTGQLILHVVFYGLPLGLMYAASERRVQRVPPMTASHAM